MSMMENFQIVELLSVIASNPDSTFAGEIAYMDGIDISNSATKKELRGGPGNGILYSTSSDFQSTLQGDCIMSTDFLKLVTSSTPTTGLQKLMDSRVIKSSGTTITLLETPASGGKMHIFPLDTHGKRMEELRVGTPATNATDYSITGKNITVHNSLSGKSFKVIYEYEKDGFEFAKEARDSSIYRLTGLAKIVDLATKEKKTANIIIPAFKPEVAFNIGASNADMTKATLQGECLIDAATNKSWYFVGEN